jgi:signal transduction histidine kinase
MDEEFVEVEYDINNLKARGWVVEYFRTVQDALNALNAGSAPFDAAVLDYDMKDEHASGITVLQAIRRRPDLDRVCVVILTKKGTMPLAVECLREGAFHCVDKYSSDAKNLERILLSGITLERAHALRRELVSQPDLASASERVRGIILDVLSNVDLFISYFGVNGAVTDGHLGDRLDQTRPFVMEVMKSNRAVLEVDTERIAALRPINKKAQEVLTAPIAGPHDAVVGVIHIEALIPSTLDPNWRRVIGYLADLLGFAHEAQAAINIERRRVEELETTASEFAHRISTPLQPITIQAQQLLDKDLPCLQSFHVPAELTEEMIERVTTVRRNALDIRDVTNHLRAITKPWNPQKLRFSAGELVRKRGGELRDELAAKFITFRAALDPPGEEPALHADEEQIGYCVQCLLRNGIEAIEERRRQISNPDYNPARDQDHIDVEAYALASGDVTISVADTGTGVADNIREHLFKPLFSTKRRIDPSGMGLFSVRRIMMLHGGTVTCESPEKGARFTLRFPALSR